MSHMYVVYHKRSRFDHNSLSNRLSDWTKTKTYTCMKMLFDNMKLKLVALNIAGVEYIRTTKQNNKTRVASNSAKKTKKNNLNPNDDFLRRICGPFLALARKQSDMKYCVAYLTKEVGLALLPPNLVGSSTPYV
jgi:hypothetical protein